MKRRIAKGIAVVLVMASMFTLQGLTSFAVEDADADSGVLEDAAAEEASDGWEDGDYQEGGPLLENSWRYENGVLIESEESDTGITAASSANVLMKGIDVSEWNSRITVDGKETIQYIDWEKVKASGIDFVILRCGYGSDHRSQDDRFWARNVAECERLGIPYGVYLYSYATDTQMAASEAQHVLRLIKGHNLAFPVYYDLEDDRIVNSDHAAITETFCNIISNAGYQVGVYSGLNWWNNYLTDASFAKWDRWVAQWNKTCDYTGKYTMWQYTSDGSVDGISGRVDMDYVVDTGLTYSDVYTDSWYWPYVRYASQTGIMTGLNEKQFGPGEQLARAQFATILYRMAGTPAAEWGDYFPDVPSGEFYSEAVSWAYTDPAKIITGYTDSGLFGPGDSITREQLVTMLYRYAGKIDADTSERADLKEFPDAGNVNEFAKEAMQWAVAAGLIKGDNGKLNPQGTAVRAECATIIMRFINITNE